MRNGSIVVFALAVGCSPQISVSNTRTLPHPSATGSVAANEIDQLGHHVSLTKVTQDEICIDVWAKVSGFPPKDAIATAIQYVEFRLARRTGKIVGSCIGRSQRSHASCASTEPFSGATVTAFAPVIVEVSPRKIPTQQTEYTGNRETVCVEELVNRYDNTVGCARYVEQDERRRIYVDGYRYHARGGNRTCFPNNGRIGPTTTSFTFAYWNTPMRFKFTSGKAVGGAWGGTGGVPAESQPLANIPEQPTAAGPSSPASATPVAPAPTTKPKATPPATTTKTPASAPAPAPTPAPNDPLLARADPTFAIPRTKITNQGRVVVEVDARGVLTDGKRVLGTWKGGALIVKGRSTLVVTADGDVLTAGSKRYARFDGNRLVFENGATITIDDTLRLRGTEPNGKVLVSKATVQTTKAGRRLALLLAALQFARLGFGPSS